LCRWVDVVAIGIQGRGCCCYSLLLLLLLLLLLYMGTQVRRRGIVISKTSRRMIKSEIDARVIAVIAATTTYLRS